MGWASRHIDRLKSGESFEFSAPNGHSMSGLIKPGDTIAVEPAAGKELRSGMIVLCIVRNSQYLHLIKQVSADQVLIGNNRGGINGWTPKTKVFGICVNKDGR